VLGVDQLGVRPLPQVEFHTPTLVDRDDVVGLVVELPVDDLTGSAVAQRVMPGGGVVVQGLAEFVSGQGGEEGCRADRGLCSAGGNSGTLLEKALDPRGHR